MKKIKPRWIANLELTTQVIWRVCGYLVILVCLSACVLNNKMTIESNLGHQRTFTIDEFEFHFPSESDVHYVPLQGASWVLSGDISEISRTAVAKIERSSRVLLSKEPGSQLNIIEITINYGDRRIGGRVADPDIGLSMQFDGQYDGELVENCDAVQVIPAHQPPVQHSLFATRDQMRVMIQPVFEKLIADALHEAIFLSLICLSQEAISQSQE